MLRLATPQTRFAILGKRPRPVAKLDRASVFTFFENYSTSITIIELLSTNSRPSGQGAACACSHTGFSSDRNAFLATLFTLSNFQCSVKAFLHSILDYFPSTLSTNKHPMIELSWIVIVGCRTHCSKDLNINIRVEQSFFDMLFILRVRM
jgi:hypothetical protein